MNNILNIIIIIALVLFIAYNIFEIVMTINFYKKLEKENKELIDMLINETADNLLGDDKNE